MTDPTAVPINMFENDRELMVVTPMPGVAPEDISIDVTDDGQLTVRAAMHGEGQERIAHILREWSYGPYERTIELPCAVDVRRANLTFGNGVLSISFPKADATNAGRVLVQRTGPHPRHDRRPLGYPRRLRAGIEQGDPLLPAPRQGRRAAGKQRRRATADRAWQEGAPFGRAALAPPEPAS